MNLKFKGKLVGGLFAVLMAVMLFAGSTGSAKASDGNYDGNHNYNNSNYGGGGYGSYQMLMLPSIDYMKSALMQGFNFTNDVNFANHTNVGYGLNATTESYNQGYLNNGFTSGHNNYGMGDVFGMNSLFSWLTGLLGGHGGGNFSITY